MRTEMDGALTIGRSRNGKVQGDFEKVNGNTARNSIERQIEQIERIPVFGPYLSLMAAAQLTLADALGLTNLRAALYAPPAQSGAPVDQPPALPSSRLPQPHEDAAESLRRAA